MATFNLYQLHGMLQGVAFLILFPIGILVATFRDAIGPSWLKIHITFQALATICVLTAIVLVKVATYKSSNTKQTGEENQHQHNHEKNQDDPKKAYRIAHKILGPIVVTLILLQWVIALVLKRKMDWLAWYNLHRATALLIISLGLIQVFMGYKLTH